MKQKLAIFLAVVISSFSLAAKSECAAPDIYGQLYLIVTYCQFNYIGMPTQYEACLAQSGFGQAAMWYAEAESYLQNDDICSYQNYYWAASEMEDWAQSHN